MTNPSDQTDTVLGQDPDGLPAGPPATAAGGTVNGRYRLDERVAVGGMASVWRAHDQVLARTVAVKILHDHLAADAGFRERFRREAVAAAKLTHPNVVGLYDTGVDGERVWLVMEFVEGRTLRDLIAERGPLPAGEAASIGWQVARALDYAHRRGLIHRDVKPANILLGDDGSVKVADFGIAKAEEAGDDLTRTGLVLGTAAYVAPEQVLDETVDGAADQYALGCVLYEAVSGHRPFDGESSVATAARRLDHDARPLRELRPDVPAEFASVVMRALSRRPSDRHASAADMADALAAVADTRGLATSPLPRRSADDPVGGATRGEPPGQEAPDVARPPGDSFLRSEGRWLLPVALVLLAVGGLIGAGLATGVFEPADPALSAGIEAPEDDEGDAPAGDGETAPDDGTEEREPGAIAVADVGVFDPQGSGSENDDRLANLFDGDAATTWRTQTYTTADFGNLKDGVGFWLDLGEVHEIHAVAVTSAAPGVGMEVRVADEPADTATGWQAVGARESVDGETVIALDDPATSRYVLVWITGPLQPSGGGYAAELASVTVEGTP